MSVKIIVDSSANASPDVLEKLCVVPLTLHFGDTEYIDGVTIDNEMFYKLLETSSDLPGTSQATPAMFSSVFDEIKSNGDSAVVITLASKLSGTHHSAVLAAQEYDNIYVVDSATASLGTGVLAARALSLAESGMSAAGIAETIENEKSKVCIIAMLDTLEYLRRGGRISKTVSIAGGLLHIKPVICLEDGEIQLVGKARGTKQGNTMLTEEIEKSGGVDFEKPALLGYTGLSDTLLQSYIEDDGDAMWKPGSYKTSVVGSIIGTHAGPGAVAAAYFRK